MLRFSAKTIIIVCIIQSIWVASISSSMLPPIEKLQTIQILIKCTDFKFQFENNTIFKEFLVHKSFICLDVIKRIYTIANRGDSSAFIKAKIMFNASRINHKIPLPAGVGHFSNFLSLLKGTALYSLYPIPPFPLSPFLYICRMSFNSHCDIAHVIGFILIIKWNAFAFRLFTFLGLGWDYGFIEWKCTFLLYKIDFSLTSNILTIYCLPYR